MLVQVQHVAPGTRHLCKYRPRTTQYVVSKISAITQVTGTRTILEPDTYKRTSGLPLMEKKEYVGMWLVSNTHQNLNRY
jgi:hypothetical protein